MLKSIDPLLNGTLLSILDDMGHGSEIAIADANFPAVDVARRHVELTGVSADRVLEALLSVLPLDDFVEAPAAVMVAPGEAEPMYEGFGRLIDAAEGRAVRVERIEPAAFVARARAAAAVISSGERRLYGNVLLRKGVIRLGTGAA